VTFEAGEKGSCDRSSARRFRAAVQCPAGMAWRRTERPTLPICGCWPSSVPRARSIEDEEWTRALSTIDGLISKRDDRRRSCFSCTRSLRQSPADLQRSSASDRASCPGILDLHRRRRQRTKLHVVLMSEVAAAGPRAWLASPVGQSLRDSPRGVCPRGPGSAQPRQGLCPDSGCSLRVDKGG